MYRQKWRLLGVLIVSLVTLTGCFTEDDLSLCSPVLITPTPSHSDFKKFSILGPEVNGEISSVFVEDHFAYINVGKSLVILDVHNPEKPIQRGVYKGGAVPVKIEDDFAYAYWDEKLHLLDISNPDDIAEVGCPQNSNLDLRGAEFSEGYAYRPEGMEGLRIYDVSEISAPIEVASYQSSTSPDLIWSTPPGELLPRPYYIRPHPKLILDVVISGNYAYVGEGQQGIDSIFGGQQTVLDISSPNKPKKVGFYIMPRNSAAMRVMVEGNYVYVSTYSMYEAQLTVVLDISNPKEPVEVASFPSGALRAVYNGFAYFHDHEAGLVVWDMSDPSSPDLVGTIELPVVYSARYVGPAVHISDIAFEDNYAYIAMEYGGLHILDVSDPANTYEVSVVQYPILPGGRTLSISDNLAYLGSGNIRVLDLSDSHTLPELGRLEGLEVKDIVIRDGLAFIARGEYGFSVVDVSDLEAPNIISSYSSDNINYDGIGLVDNLAFILEVDVGLHIFDINDPVNLIKLSTVDLNVTHYNDLTVWNEYLYVTQGGNEGELTVIDISDPTKPKISNHLTYPDFFTSIVVGENYLYVVTSWNLITVFDIKNPVEPSLVSVHDSENFIEDVDFENGELYLSLRFDDGIAVVEFDLP